MVDAHARIERARQLAASPDDAWALLMDIPRWGMLFPHVESVEPYPEAGPDAFRWQMEPLGPPGGRVQTVYACRYRADVETRTLVWTPVVGVGTARFAGHCTLAASASGTAGHLVMEATLRIPAPSFLKGVVVPMVQAEMGRMTDTFLDRLDAAIAA